MLDVSTSKLFGSKTRTRVLMLLAILDESYPSEIARLLEARVFSVQQIVDDLDRQGVVASRYSGRIRRVSLSPTYYAARELKALLLRLIDAHPELKRTATMRRSRPRRKGSRL